MEVPPPPPGVILVILRQYIYMLHVYLIYVGPYLYETNTYFILIFLINSGIHTVVTNDFAKKFILGLEKDKMCVIEIGKMISRSSKDLPPAASAFHSQPAVLSGHETQHRAVSARDTNPRFSRGESFR